MHKRVYFLGVASIIIVILIIGLHFLYSFTPEYPILELNKGWTVIYRNERFLNTNLEHLSNEVGATFSKGDTLTLTLADPLDYPEVPFPSLVFKTQFCAYEVYLDSELIAEDYTNDISGFTFIGNGYNTIELPADITGKNLSIKLYVTENNSRADIMSPQLGNLDDIYRNILHKVFYPAFTAIFMILFGIVFLVISLVFYVRTSGVASQIICSILSTVVGFWMVNSFDSIDFYIAPSSATFIEYTALYLIVPLGYILVYNLHPRNNNLVVSFLGYTSLGFAFLFIFLHILNIVHIHHFLNPYIIMSFVAFGILIIYDIKDIRYKSKNSSRQILMLGFTVLSLTMIVYAITAILKVFIDYRQNLLLDILVPTGSLFFVLTQLLNHFIFMTRSFAQRKEYASLTQIAYIDNLTEIPNRVSCDKKMVELGKTETDFCILSLDLNGLKEVNDNSGHPAGDRLLKSFASCLKDVFEGSGEYFRVGGDEFLVLFDSIDKGLLDSMLMTLDSKLLELDAKDPEANHSVSYGYAFSSETDDRNTHTVFMLADQRMYQYKRRYYSHMMKR